MARADYSIAKIQLWMEVGGKIVDVSSLQLTYSLNAIPRAAVVLAAGVQARTGRPSNAFEIAEADAFVPCKLFLQGVQGAASQLNVLTLNGKYELFDGYVTGTNGSLNRGLQLKAELTHWLTDLNYGSAISAGSSPENPWQFSFNAAVPGKSDATTSGTSHFLPITKAQQTINHVAVQTDLWGLGILPWLKDLAASDRINLPEFGKNDTPDKTVAAALDRFDGEKLPLDSAGEDYIAVARAISDDIGVLSTNPGSNNNHLIGLANTTLWDKLVGEIAPLYRFAIAPFPGKAKAIPFTAGLRTVWRSVGGATLKNSDIVGLDITSTMIRPLGGVGIYCSFNSAAGGMIPPESPPSGLHIGGQFVGSKDGMIMLKRAPRWLDQIPLPRIEAAGPLTGDVAADMMAPRAGDSPAARPSDTVATTKSLFNKFAQSLYIDEVLQHRLSQVISPLRFDICPGSTVSFQGHRGATAQRGIRYGSVVAVSYMVDAEQLQAYTVFTIAHVRTDKENKQDAFSIARHPLYDNLWTGSPLIEPV